MRPVVKFLLGGKAEVDIRKHALCLLRYISRTALMQCAICEPSGGQNVQSR